MRQLFPTFLDLGDPSTIYDDLQFPLWPDRPYVFANMVASVDGKAQIDGTAAGLGSRVDHALLVRLRALADAVLEGAGTVRADRTYAVLPPERAAQRLGKGMTAQPRWAVASRSGRLPLDAAIFRRPELPPIVLVSELAPAGRIGPLAKVADVIALPGDPPNLLPGLVSMRQRLGVRWVLTEGGPNFLHSLLQQRLLDELFLTLAPKVVSGDVKTIVEGSVLARPFPSLALISLFEHQGELYMRYRVSPDLRTTRQ